MGCLMSKIYDDEREWEFFCREHNLKLPDDPYSYEARVAYQAASKGLEGKWIEEYVYASKKADSLRKQADDLMKPFDELVKIKKLIKSTTV